MYFNENIINNTLTEIFFLVFQNVFTFSFISLQTKKNEKSKIKVIAFLTQHGKLIRSFLCK